MTAKEIRDAVEVYLAERKELKGKFLTCKDLADFIEWLAVDPSPKQAACAREFRALGVRLDAETFGLLDGSGQTVREMLEADGHLFDSRHERVAEHFAENRRRILGHD